MSAADQAAALRRARRRLAARQQYGHLNLEVPGWGDDLIARVEAVAGSQLAKRVAAWSRDDGVGATADLIAAAVTRLSVRQADGTLTVLLDPDTDEPLCFGPGFGPALDAPHCTTARGAVLLAFSSGAPPTVDDVALFAFMARIRLWAAPGGRRAGDAVTVAELATRLQVSSRTVTRAIDRGDLRASRLADRGCWRIRPEDVDAWLEARANRPRHAGPEAPAPARPVRAAPGRRARATDDRLPLPPRTKRT